MSISIVMLTYNNYETFLRSMTSMFYFITEPRIKEFIFLDNGSHEMELKKFLRNLDEQISKVRVIFSDKNLGISKGRKILYDACEGDYIVSFDSDIVIVNPLLFLEVFHNALSLPNMMLVGGGGGDHPFFPSLEKENIDNKDSPESPHEVKVVDEVAGWFHGFKSKILTKNGGKIEMDEQFSPFWAEDSDFCMQIKVLGGKCCIMGKGVVAHQWSSCDKKKTQITLEDMWNKFQDKWYTKFGEDFKFEIENKFYEDNYPTCKSVLRPREFYHKIGMIEGHIHSKDVIRHVFPESKFLNNKTIEYENNKYTINEFDNKFFQYENIVKKHFKIIGGNLPKNVENLILITVFDVEKGIDIIKNLISMQKPYVVVTLTESIHPQHFVEILRKYDCPFLITSFTNFNFDLIPYIVTVKELIKTHKYRITNILNLSTARDNSSYIQKPISDFKSGFYLQNQVQKIDNFCLSFIDQVLSLAENMAWNKDCVYYETSEYLIKLFDSLPIMETFIKCIKIPRSYILHISPRCSPKHSLERLIGYMKPLVRDRKTYYTIICDINDQDDLKKVSNNISYLTNGDICIFNKGSVNRISHKDLPYDYYYHVDKKDTENKELMLYSLSNIQLELYTNFVFCDDSFEILENIDEFLERSVYKNTCFSQKNDKYDTSLYSILLGSIIHFSNEMKSEKFDIQECLKKSNSKFLWVSKIQENDEETIIEYYKPGIDTGEDFPLI